MGPWFLAKKNTNASEDAVFQRHGGTPRQVPASRPSRIPYGPRRSSTRLQDSSIIREREERVQARQVARGEGHPQGRSEGQPQGRAVARSHGRPAPKRPAAAGGPEGSASHHHVSQAPRQTGVLPTPPSSRQLISQETFPNERVRTQSNSSDPRVTEAMRNQWDKQSVKNLCNARPNQGTVGLQESQARPAGRAGPQPGPVTARGGVPRPPRPPAPGQTPSVVRAKRPETSRERNRLSAPNREQPVTSASIDGNTTASANNETRSGQQIIINPRPKGQTKANSQSQNDNNQNNAASTSKAKNSSRTYNTANNDQSRLPNNQSSGADSSAVYRISSQTVQKAGNNNNSPCCNIKTEDHGGYKINNVVTGCNINRHSSSSNTSDNTMTNDATGNNARNKHKNKTMAKDTAKLDNVNITKTMATNSLEEDANVENIEGSVEASGPGNDSRQNPSPNGDNPNVKQDQRADDSAKNKETVESLEVLRQRAPHVGTHRQGQRSASDHIETQETRDAPSEGNELADRNVAVSRASSTTSNATRNARNRPQSVVNSVVNSSSIKRGSGEGKAPNSATGGARERPDGSEQSSRNTVAKPATSRNRAKATGSSQKPSTDRASSRETMENTQRSNRNREGLNGEESSIRDQRIARACVPSSPAATTNSRITNRRQPQNANASSTNATNSALDSANIDSNIVVSSARRGEIVEVNTGPRNNNTERSNNTSVENSNTRPPVQARVTVQNNRNSENNSVTRGSGHCTINMSTPVTAQAGSSSGSRQQRRGQGGVSLDPNQLTVDIIDNSGSFSDQPPPYVATDVHRCNNHVGGNLVSGRGSSNNRPNQPNQVLPDILNSHVHAPLCQNESRSTRRGCRNQQRSSGNRDCGSSRGNRTRRTVATNEVPSGGCQRSRRPPRGTTRLDSNASLEGCSKWGCLRCMTIVTTFRWILVTLALLGVCCVLTGIVLGALHMTIESSFLTLSLMFIGLGVMLVIVVGVGWKCTPRGHEPCHLLFNLGDHTTNWNDIRVESTARSRSNPRNHWAGGTIYDEFQYRRPPPSYNASMQDYQQQLARAQIRFTQSQQNAVENTPSSPPPTYKSHASLVRPGLHITFPILQGEDYPTSRPPTYRSTVGTLNRPRINTNTNENDDHSANNRRGAEADREQIMNERNSSQNRAETPASPSPTLQRANQVVGYLDNVLDSSLREMERTTNRDITQGQQQEIETSNNNNDNDDNANQSSSNSSETNNEQTCRDNITAESSSGSGGSGATSNINIEGLNRNSLNSRNNGDGHIVADTHL